MAPTGQTVVDMLIERAVGHRAGSLHLEPVADGLAVRERIHGIMRPADEVLPEEARAGIVEALKTRAGMTMEVDTLPQDTRFFASVDGRKIDIRCTAYPTELGESFTLRILDPACVNLSFSNTGFRPATRDAILAAVGSNPKGVFLVNGPSGAGKTTTSYSLLAELNRPEVKIMTVEDPVEFRIDGVLQAPLRNGLRFSTAMRAMLRADLDIGFVGEMRDAESLQLLFQMGATGHKMFSQLHADDPAMALVRMLDLGLSPRTIVDQLLGLLDQRLVPRVCQACSSRRPMTAEEAAQMGLSGREDDYEVAQHTPGTPCDACSGTGVRGRTVVGELWTITPALRVALEAETVTVDSLRRAARESGFPTMRDDMLARVAAGEVSAATAIGVLGRRLLGE